MDIITVLQVYVPLALAVFGIGVGTKLARWAVMAVRSGTFSGRSQNELDTPQRESPLGALWRVLSMPVKRSTAGNRLWTAGYVLYHAGIITIVAGYTLAGLLLAVNLLQGNPVPNMETGATGTQNYSLVNLLAIIFGSAKSPVTEFLFGSAGPLVVGITWVAVGAALLGNIGLLISALKNKGAVTDDIDDATEGFRPSGRFQMEHLLVTGLVFGIVVTELLTRLQVVPQMLYYHLFLAMTIVLITPFTFLRHIVFFPITLYYAAKRRVNRTIA